MRFYLRAISYFRDDLPLIIASLGLIALSTLAQLLQPFILAILIDFIIQRNKGGDWIHRSFVGLTRLVGIGLDNRLGQVMVLASLAVILRVMQELLAMSQRLLNATIGYRGLMRVRCDLFRKLQQLSIGYHKSQPQGDAIYRLNYDTGGFQLILNVLVNNVLVSTVTLILMTWLMLQMNWVLTLITLSVAPLLMWTTRAFAGPLKRRWIEVKEVDSALTTVIQRSVASIGLVQAFGRETDEFNRFHQTVRNSNEANLRQAWQDSYYWLLVGTIFGLGYAAIFAYGGWAVCRHLLPLGNLTVFLAYVNQVYGPLQSVSGSAVSIQAGAAGAQRVFEILDRDPVIKDAPDAVRLPCQKRVLSLEKVCFEYRPGEPILRDVDVTIAPGQLVAFVGSSGVGKTTLLNLLPRFYDPISGTMKLDGMDVRKVRIEDLRRHIALVLQENAILPATVRENIAYGRPRASLAQIQRAAQMAGAAEFIAALPHQYETQIDESGGNLSGGQRQRISIARALLTEAPILVLDEPTSALDPQHEAVIIETLARLKGQRTIIVVSHRLSTVRQCDQIFVMHEGRIAERGDHQQLMAQRGLYFEMGRQQFAPQEPDPAQAAT